MGDGTRKQGYVKWKDILTGQWKGPDPTLTWARGSVCVFPQDSTDPVWVPERLTRAVPAPEEEPSTEHDSAPAATLGNGTNDTSPTGEG